MSSRPSRSSMKRKQNDLSDYEDSLSETEYQANKSKRRAAQPSNATSLDDKSVKKAARMERNRRMFLSPALLKHCLMCQRYEEAAQASRDRKKAYTGDLELKVRELERLLEQSRSSTSSTPSASSDQSDRIAQLESENASLRSQLATAHSENAQVKNRLDGLEAKLELLTNVIANNNSKRQQQSTTSSPCVSPLDLKQTSSPVISHPLPLFDPTTLVDLLPVASTSSAGPSTMIAELGLMRNQVEPLVARERQSLPRTSTLVLRQSTQASSSRQAKLHQQQSSLPHHTTRNQCQYSRSSLHRKSNLLLDWQENSPLSLSQHRSSIPSPPLPVRQSSTLERHQLLLRMIHNSSLIQRHPSRQQQQQQRMSLNDWERSRQNSTLMPSSRQRLLLKKGLDKASLSKSRKRQ